MELQTPGRSTDGQCLYLDDVRQAGVVTDESLHLRQRPDNGIILVPKHMEAALEIMKV